MASVYDIATNTDPLWDAYLAEYGGRQAQARADSDVRRGKAKLDYDQALRDLEQKGLVGRRNLDTNLLARGVYRSGESGRRRDELTTGLRQARDDTDVAYANTMGTIDADLQRALDELDYGREQQIAASRTRISERDMNERKYQEEQRLKQEAASAAPMSTITVGTGAVPRPAAKAVAAPRVDPGMSALADASVRNAMEDRGGPAPKPKTVKPKPVPKPSPLKPWQAPR